MTPRSLFLLASLLSLLLISEIALGDAQPLYNCPLKNQFRRESLSQEDNDRLLKIIRQVYTNIASEGFREYTTDVTLIDPHSGEDKSYVGYAATLSSPLPPKSLWTSILQELSRTIHAWSEKDAMVVMKVIDGTVIVKTPSEQEGSTDNTSTIAVIIPQLVCIERRPLKGLKALPKSDVRKFDQALSSSTPLA